MLNVCPAWFDLSAFLKSLYESGTIFQVTKPDTLPEVPYAVVALPMVEA